VSFATRAIGRAVATGAIFAGIMTVAALPLQSQSLADRAKAKLQQKHDQLVDGAVDKTTGAMACAATNTDCITNAQAAGTPVTVIDANGKPVSTADSAKAIAAAGGDAATPAAGASAATPATPAAGATGGAGPLPEDKMFVNYDFIPGDRTIFAEDFSRDNVGDFPKRLQLTEGNLEVAEKSGQRWLRSTSTATVFIPLSEVVPDRFTFEMDYVIDPTWGLQIYFGDPAKADDQNYVRASMGTAGIEGGSVKSTADVPTGAELPVAHLAVMGDGKYVKVYLDGVRVGNVPNATLARGNAIYITSSGEEGNPTLIGNIRLAAGGKKLYDALAASGKVSTHGILFDVGSDRIRAESKPTLQEIGDMLKQHPDLKLLIGGHTDNVGAAAANKALSDKRAAAVKQYLVANYGVAATRLTAKGFGSDQPVTSNDTPEGRQTNRRVELVKQ